MSELPIDRFTRYYTEKLWNLIPSIYRYEDGVAASPDMLRSLVEVMAEQAAILRRSSDRLWEDQFIDFCDDWAVPYIGDLVGTRMVSALDTRGRRVDVAKTIHYRRGAGTLPILEELIVDIAGWEGRVVEEFRRLLRHPHGLDVSPAATGRLTGTPAHGLPDLRSARGAELRSHPWDEFHYFPDMRRNKGGMDGRYGITKLAFHLFRLGAFEVADAMPHMLAPDGNGKQRFTFDPSGRAIPLFQRRNRPSTTTRWRAAALWEVPAPIRCEILGHAEYEIGEAAIQSWLKAGLISTSQADALRTIRGIRFSGEDRFRARLSILPMAALGAGALHRVLADALIADCGKAALLPGDNLAIAGFLPSVEVDVAATAVAREMTIAGNLLARVIAPSDKDLVIDAENGIGYFTAGTPPANTSVTYHYGFAGDIGAGCYSHGDQPDAPLGSQFSGGGAIAGVTNPPLNALAEFVDNATYGPIGDRVVRESLTIRTRDFCRPYLELAGDWTLTAKQPRSTLVLDGLWLGGKGKRVVRLAATPGNGWSSVMLSHCTFDPGGQDADANQLGPVYLSIESRVDSLTIDSCIMGPIGAAGAGFAEQAALSDSIVHATQAADAALALDHGVVDIRRCTILGTTTVHQLEASEVLATKAITVADVQYGCIRFSAFPSASVVPRAYRCTTLDDAGALFTSDVFGQPGYTQLSDVAPDAIFRGGENGTEIGAWNSLLNPIKLASLKAKVDEFLPFGLIPLFVTET